MNDPSDLDLAKAQRAFDEANTTTPSLADLLQEARERRLRGEPAMAPGDRPTDPKGAELYNRIQAAKARVRAYHADEPLSGHGRHMSNRRFKDLTARGTPLTPAERAEVQAEVDRRRARRGEL